MPSIVYFEIPAEDMDRAQEFYRKIFDWDIAAVPGVDKDQYLTVRSKTLGGSTGPLGALVGGDCRIPQLMNYIGVEDVAACCKEIKESGGQVLVERTEISGLGFVAVCADTEGNPIGLWQWDQAAQPGQPVKGGEQG